MIPKEGFDLTEDAVKDAVRANMARHKVPKYVILTDSFPMNAAGKIQKFKLRDEATEKLGLQDAASIVTA